MPGRMPSIKVAKVKGPKSAKALEKEFLARRSMKAQSGQARGYNPYRDAHGRFAPGPHKAKGTAKHASAAVGAFNRARKLAAARGGVKAAATPSVKAHVAARQRAQAKATAAVKAMREAAKPKPPASPKSMAEAAMKRNPEERGSLGKAEAPMAKPAIGANEKASPSAPKNVHFSAKVDESFKDEVSKAVGELPKSVVGHLEKAGYNIYAVHSMTGENPKLKGKRPNGYPEGATWDHVDGIHVAGKKEIIVAQMKADFGSDKIVRTNRATAVLFHEIGHGVDHAMGDVSARPEFREAYNKDVQAIPEGVRKRFGYYLQGGDVGPREAFAETFAQHHGKMTAATYILGNFPNTYSYVKGLL